MERTETMRKVENEVRSKKHSKFLKEFNSQANDLIWNSVIWRKIKLSDIPYVVRASSCAYQAAYRIVCEVDLKKNERFEMFFEVTEITITDILRMAKEMNEWLFEGELHATIRIFKSCIQTFFWNDENMQVKSQFTTDYLIPFEEELREILGYDVNGNIR